MKETDLRKLLIDIKAGKVSVEEGFNLLRGLFYRDLGFAKLDLHRELRTGYGEVIFCAGKTKEQIKTIFQALLREDVLNVMATRADQDIFEEIKSFCPDAVYHPQARIITVQREEIVYTKSYISIVSAGTSDLPVAEEAAVTAEFFGNRTVRIYDVGVAGIHRLLSHLDTIQGGRVCIVIAGMEGALPSVLGGLIDKPIIAVPTSVGYGASFQGLSALLAMLNSCAPGVTVVNIDNGFGAALAASKINKLP